VAKITTLDLFEGILSEREVVVLIDDDWTILHAIVCIFLRIIEIAI
jgi:hypothetical protein